MLAVGESQSAFTLTTYVDGVQPLTHEFDGFLIHSRAGAPAPLGAPGAGIDIAGSLSGKPTIIRTDQEVPVILVETETDVLGVLGYYPAQQADNRASAPVGGGRRRARRQVPGRLGRVHVRLRRADQPGPAELRARIRRQPLEHLGRRWRRAAEAARLAIDTSGAAPSYVLDPVGNVKGGVRTPVLDAPVDVLSGLPAPKSSVICLLSGTTTPIPADRLATLYPSRAAYLTAYTKATDAAIKAGFVLAR